MTTPQGHILVVEPNDITRKLLVGILNKRGYETFEAKNGDDASAYFKKNLQVVIVDIENDDPSLTGLIHKLQVENSSLLVIAMTDESDLLEVQKRLNIMDVSLLQKPVMPDRLIQNIESYFIPALEEKVAEEIISRADTEAAAEAAVNASNPELNAQREEFMRRAIDISQEKMDEDAGGPFGAVVVRRGKIIGEGWSAVTSTNDPTAHAEIMAIRNAGKAIGDYDLSGCEIYTSCEPCAMGLAAIYWARIDRVFYGCTQEDTESAGFDNDYIAREMAQPEHKRSLPSKMFLREEAKIVFENWIKKKDKVTY